MFEDDIEFTQDDAQKCEDCEFYLCIDSGYGYCRRFPPQWHNRGNWLKPKWVLEYQLTEWCRRSCGEFQKPVSPTGGKIG